MSLQLYDMPSRAVWAVQPGDVPRQTRAHNVYVKPLCAATHLSVRHPRRQHREKENPAVCGARRKACGRAYRATFCSSQAAGGSKLPLALTPSEASEVSRESFGPPGPPPTRPLYHGGWSAALDSVRKYQRILACLRSALGRRTTGTHDAHASSTPHHIN